MKKAIDQAKLCEALQLLNEQLELSDAPYTEIVVCGGSALIAIELVARTTRDVDVIALLENGQLQQSEPLPEHLARAAEAVQEILQLPADWLNSGPSSQLSMGLPAGFSTRLHRVEVGANWWYITSTAQTRYISRPLPQPTEAVTISAT